MERTNLEPRVSDALIEQALAELEQVVRQHRQGMVRERQRLPMSLSHLHVLMVLDAGGAVPMHRLAESLACSMPNATGIVDRMEERGLVQRLRDERDRRLVLARITEVGQAALGEFETIRQGHMRRLLAAMSRSDQQLCLDAFRRIRETAERLDGPASGGSV